MKTINFTATLYKFGNNGEKTGWTYIEIPGELATQLHTADKKSFRVKGRLDAHPIQGATLIPYGHGDYILPVNAAMRKGIHKKEGAMVDVELAIDKKEYVMNAELMACLNDDPEALAFFNTLAGSHQRYFSKWIDAAKTEQTKTKRIAMAVDGLSKKMGYNIMIRFHKEK